MRTAFIGIVLILLSIDLFGRWRKIETKVEMAALVINGTLIVLGVTALFSEN